MTLKEILKKLMGLEDQDPGERQQKGQYNKRLMEEIRNCFVQNLEADSVGTQMIYPMSFIILVNNEDYEERKDQFLLIQRQIINVFYEEIRSRKSKYPDYYTFNWWHLQFIPMSEDSSIVGNTDIGELKKGDIAILARLSEERPEDKSYPSNQKTESNVRVSLRSGNSVVYQTRNININLLTHVDIEGENNFWVKFDESLRPLKVEAKKDSGTKGMDTDTTYATLSWMLNPGQKATFSMITPSIEITGKGDSRKRADICRIETPGVGRSHALLRFNGEKFEICPFGEMRRGERIIPSCSPERQIWTPIPDDCDLLFLNDEGDTAVKFSKAR